MVCGLKDVSLSDPPHHKVKYSALQFPGSSRRGRFNVNCVMALLVITCAVLLVIIAYMIGTKLGNSEAHTDHEVAGQASNASRLPGSGDIDAALKLHSDDSVTAEGTEIPQEETTLDTAESNVTRASGESSESVNITHLSRGSLTQLMDEVVEKIRGGHEHKEALQIHLLMLQNQLKRLDEAAAKKKKVIHDNTYGSEEEGGFEEKGEDEKEHELGHQEGNYSNVTSIEKVTAKEEERVSGPRTIDYPQVKRKMDILHTSPSTLDKYDFSTQLTWDFACFPKYLVGERPTQVCVDNSAYDREFLEAVTEDGKWQNKMLSVFVEYLNTKFTMQVLDLGSNIGVFSLAAAALGRKVLAVEPCMKYILPFHKSVQQNRFQNRISLVTNALSDEYKLIQLINDPKGDPRKTRTVDVSDVLLNNDVIDPRDVARSVKLSDLQPALKYPEALMKIDLNGDEARVFRKSHYLFESGRVSAVLMEWHYDNNPRDYDYIILFFRMKGFVPRFSPHGPRVTYIGLTKYQPFIIWIKEA